MVLAAAVSGSLTATAVAVAAAGTLNGKFNPIPTGHGQNQPIYERHVTTAGRNRVKDRPSEILLSCNDVVW
jgi:hypothetical protein